MKMNELMIYQVFPLRALTDGQPSHGILEMIDWIPHIKKLGMNAVYFSPVFSSSDHGYDTPADITVRNSAPCWEL